MFKKFVSIFGFNWKDEVEVTKKRKTRKVLTQTEKAMVRNDITRGVTRKQIGIDYDISQAYISRIVKGK